MVQARELPAALAAQRALKQRERCSPRTLQLHPLEPILTGMRCLEHHRDTVRDAAVIAGASDSGLAARCGPNLNRGSRRQQARAEHEKRAFSSITCAHRGATLS